VALAALIAVGRADAACVKGISAHSLDPSEAARYRDVGFRVVRLDLAYSAVIHADVEAWQAHDAAVDALVRHGLTPLLILHYDVGAGFSADDDIRRFAEFASRASRRYPSAMFELLNEPNLTPAQTAVPSWLYVEPARYADVVREVRAAVGPRIKLLGPGIGGGDCTGLDWLAAVAEAGGLEPLDAVTVHPYCVGRPDGLRAYLERARAIAGAVPVVASEWGFAADDEAEQAAQISRALDVAEELDLDMLVLYRWDAQDAFGLHRPDGSPRPALMMVR
jgi:hypothetical protein